MEVVKVMTKKVFKKTGKKVDKTDKNAEHYEVKVKEEKDSFLAVILKQNKSLSLQWVSFEYDEFRNDGHTYFSVPEGMYLGKKRLLMGIYLEGISTPLSHRNVKKKTIQRERTLSDGATEKYDVDVIEGLKYDSEIIDILLNRGLAEKFTTVRPEKTIFVLIMLVIISIIVGIVAVGVEFI